MVFLGVVVIKLLLFKFSVLFGVRGRIGVGYSRLGSIVCFEGKVIVFVDWVIGLMVVILMLLVFLLCGRNGKVGVCCYMLVWL